MIFNRFGSEENKYQLLIITILSVILFSYVINKFVEVPFAKWIKIKLSKL
jgi:peptidoglycan/LPS O-acetylase OafA/YrhL